MPVIDESDDPWILQEAMESHSAMRWESSSAFFSSMLPALSPDMAESIFQNLFCGLP